MMTLDARCLLAIACCVLAPSGHAQDAGGAPPAAETQSTAETRSPRALFDAEEFQAAAEAWAKAFEQDDENADLAYNLALARWRAGDPDGAETAAELAATLSGGRYAKLRDGILGNLRFDEARALLATDGGGTGTGNLALKRAKEAVEHFRRGALACANDDPARGPLVRNLDRARRLVEKIDALPREESEEGEPSEGQSEDEKQDEQDKKDGQDKKNEQSGSEGESGENKPDENKPGEEGESEPQPGESQSESEEGSESGEQESGEQESGEPNSGEQKPSEEPAAPEPDPSGDPSPPSSDPSDPSAEPGEAGAQPGSEAEEAPPPEAGEEQPGQGEPPLPEELTESDNAPPTQNVGPPRRLTEAETKRLLQQLADIERRRIELRAKQRRRRPTVERDW